MASFYKKLIKILKDEEWVLYRQGKGSHEIWINHEKNLKVTVPYDCKKKHTANEVLKQARIGKKF